MKSMAKMLIQVRNIFPPLKIEITATFVLSLDNWIVLPRVLSTLVGFFIRPKIIVTKIIIPSEYSA
jgi:hypothetical protein